MSGSSEERQRGPEAMSGNPEDGASRMPDAESIQLAEDLIAKYREEAPRSSETGALLIGEHADATRQMARLREPDLDGIVRHIKQAEHDLEYHAGVELGMCNLDERIDAGVLRDFEHMMAAAATAVRWWADRPASEFVPKEPVEHEGGYEDGYKAGFEAGRLDALQQIAMMRAMSALGEAQHRLSQRKPNAGTCIDAAQKGLQAMVLDTEAPRDHLRLAADLYDTIARACAMQRDINERQGTRR